MTPRVSPTASRKPAASNDPWRWSIVGRTLVVAFPEPWLVLGWAPLGGGFKRADLIINHQIEMGDFAATGAPRKHLISVIGSLRCGSAFTIEDVANGAGPRSGASTAVGMMTGAQVARAGHTTLRRDGLAVGAWCTAGCSNALRVGDRATAGVPRARDAKCPQTRPNAPGTINIIVTISQPLTRSAMAEALQIAVEARVAAVSEAAVTSTQSGGIATGTGTDCIVVAAPVAAQSDRANTIIYCGKHTLPGELIGRAVMRSSATAIVRANPSNPVDDPPPRQPDSN